MDKKELKTVSIIYDTAKDSSIVLPRAITESITRAEEDDANIVLFEDGNDIIAVTQKDMVTFRLIMDDLVDMGYYRTFYITPDGLVFKV